MRSATLLFALLGLCILLNGKFGSPARSAHSLAEISSEQSVLEKREAAYRANNVGVALLDEVLIRVSAYMDPWGPTEPMAWWTVINRARAIENIAYVAATNQGASLKHYPPYSWPGGSQVIDFDGRVLAEASPGPGERIVVAPIDISALRHERASRRGHHMLAHLRTEAYPVYQRHRYPPHIGESLSYEKNNELIGEAKKSLT